MSDTAAERKKAKEAYLKALEDQRISKLANGPTQNNELSKPSMPQHGATALDKREQMLEERRRKFFEKNTASAPTNVAADPYSASNHTYNDSLAPSTANNNQGYNAPVLSTKYERPAVPTINEKVNLNEWRSKGYPSEYAYAKDLGLLDAAKAPVVAPPPVVVPPSAVDYSGGYSFNPPPVVVAAAAAAPIRTAAAVIPSLNFNAPVPSIPTSAVPASDPREMKRLKQEEYARQMQADSALKSAAAISHAESQQSRAALPQQQHHQHRGGDPYNHALPQQPINNKDSEHARKIQLQNEYKAQLDMQQQISQQQQQQQQSGNQRHISPLQRHQAALAAVDAVPSFNIGSDGFSEKEQKRAKQESYARELQHQQEMVQQQQLESKLNKPLSAAGGGALAGFGNGYDSQQQAQQLKIQQQQEYARQLNTEKQLNEQLKQAQNTARLQHNQYNQHEQGGPSFNIGGGGVREADIERELKRLKQEEYTRGLDQQMRQKDSHSDKHGRGVYSEAIQRQHQQQQQNPGTNSAYNNVASERDAKRAKQEAYARELQYQQQIASLQQEQQQQNSRHDRSQSTGRGAIPPVSAIAGGNGFGDNEAARLKKVAQQQEYARLLDVEQQHSKQLKQQQAPGKPYQQVPQYQQSSNQPSQFGLAAIGAQPQNANDMKRLKQQEYANSLLQQQLLQQQKKENISNQKHAADRTALAQAASVMAPNGALDPGWMIGPLGVPVRKVLEVGNRNTQREFVKQTALSPKKFNQDQNQHQQQQGQNPFSDPYGNGDGIYGGGGGGYPSPTRAQGMAGIPGQYSDPYNTSPTAMNGFGGGGGAGGGAGNNNGYPDPWTQQQQPQLQGFGQQQQQPVPFNNKYATANPSAGPSVALVGSDLDDRALKQKALKQDQAAVLLAQMEENKRAKEAEKRRIQQEEDALQAKLEHQQLELVAQHEREVKEKKQKEYEEMQAALAKQIVDKKKAKQAEEEAQKALDAKENARLAREQEVLTQKQRDEMRREAMGLDQPTAGGGGSGGGGGGGGGGAGLNNYDQQQSPRQPWHQQQLQQQRQPDYPQQEHHMPRSGERNAHLFGAPSPSPQGYTQQHQQVVPQSDLFRAHSATLSGGDASARRGYHHTSDHHNDKHRESDDYGHHSPRGHSRGGGAGGGADYFSQVASPPKSIHERGRDRDRRSSYNEQSSQSHQELQQQQQEKPPSGVNKAGLFDPASPRQEPRHQRKYNAPMSPNFERAGQRLKQRVVEESTNQHQEHQQSRQQQHRPLSHGQYSGRADNDDNGEQEEEEEELTLAQARQRQRQNPQYQQPPVTVPKANPWEQFTAESGSNSKPPSRQQPQEHAVDYQSSHMNGRQYADAQQQTSVRNTPSTNAISGNRGRPPTSTQQQPQLQQHQQHPSKQEPLVENHPEKEGDINYYQAQRRPSGFHKYDNGISYHHDPVRLDKTLVTESKFILPGGEVFRPATAQSTADSTSEHVRKYNNYIKSTDGTGNGGNGNAAGGGGLGLGDVLKNMNWNDSIQVNRQNAEKANSHHHHQHQSSPDHRSHSDKHHHHHSSSNNGGNKGSHDSRTKYHKPVVINKDTTSLIDDFRSSLMALDSSRVGPNHNSSNSHNNNTSSKLADELDPEKLYRKNRRRADVLNKLNIANDDRPTPDVVPATNRNEHEERNIGNDQHHLRNNNRHSEDREKDVVDSHLEDLYESMRNVHSRPSTASSTRPSTAYSTLPSHRYVPSSNVVQASVQQQQQQQQNAASTSNAPTAADVDAGAAVGGGFTSRKPSAADVYMQNYRINPKKGALANQLTKLNLDQLLSNDDIVQVTPGVAGVAGAGNVINAGGGSARYGEENRPSSEHQQIRHSVSSGGGVNHNEKVNGADVRGGIETSASRPTSGRVSLSARGRSVLQPTITDAAFGNDNRIRNSIQQSQAAADDGGSVRRSSRDANFAGHHSSSSGRRNSRDAALMNNSSGGDGVIYRPQSGGSRGDAVRATSSRGGAQQKQQRPSSSHVPVPVLEFDNQQQVFSSDRRRGGLDDNKDGGNDDHDDHDDGEDYSGEFDESFGEYGS